VAGAAAYGLGCRSSTAGCTWTGLAAATGQTAAGGAITGGIFATAGGTLSSAAARGSVAPEAAAAGSGADATTAVLQEHLAGAVARFNVEGLTEAQKAALVDNPGLEAAFRGQRLDTFFKESLNNAIESGSDPRLANLYVTRSGEFGPDVFDLGSMNRWWDVTTRASWAGHVARYAGFPGTGIPLFTP
jgi:hypothetical protein